MGLKIIAPTETISVKQVRMLIYGQPNSGKTTFALSGKNTLLIDCEGGLIGSNKQRYRSGAHCIQLEKWDDILELTADMLRPFNTIVFDTVMSMQELIIIYMAKIEPKNVQKDGSPTVKGWGFMAQLVKNFLAQLRSYGLDIDIIFIAHDKEDKKGDDTIVRPDIKGSFKNDICRSVDFIGYTRVIGSGKNTQYVVEFMPNETTLCKNRGGGLNEQIVLDQSPDLLTRTIQKAKDAMNSLSDEQMEIARVFDEIRLLIEDADCAEKFTAIKEQYSDKLSSDKVLKGYFQKRFDVYCEWKKDDQGNIVFTDKPRAAEPVAEVSSEQSATSEVESNDNQPSGESDAEQPTAN